MAESTSDQTAPRAATRAATGGATAGKPRLRFGLALDFGTTRATIERLLEEYLPLVKLAEGYGFDSIWLGAAPTGRTRRFHLPAPLLVLAALAPQTTMTLGTGVILLPMCHPLTLAYDAAVLDQFRADGS